jgi:fructokinase
MTLLVAGEMLVDFLPGSAGPLAEVETFTRRAGGTSANVAVALARLGRPPAYWTRVGDDGFGDFLVATLEAEGVPTDRVERDPDARTAVTFVSHDAAGEREFAIYREGAADARMQPGAVEDDALASAEWVHVGGVSLAAEPARTATFDLAERAAAADCTVSFDPNARPALFGEFDLAASVDRILGAVDVVTASVEDLAAAGIERDTPGTLARAVLERGPHTAFVTRGGDGAVGLATAAAPWGPAETSHPGFAVDVTDTTGAGDAFTAGAIDALSAGESVAETLAFANAVGAVATTADGAMAALPDREAVAALRSGRE